MDILTEKRKDWRTMNSPRNGWSTVTLEGQKVGLIVAVQKQAVRAEVTASNVYHILQMTQYRKKINVIYGCKMLAHSTKRGIAVFALTCTGSRAEQLKKKGGLHVREMVWAYTLDSNGRSQVKEESGIYFQTELLNTKDQISSSSTQLKTNAK